MPVQQPASSPVRNIELPELREIFADSLHTIAWDGQTMRLEFCVTRYPVAAAVGNTAETKRYPACRLVLAASGGAALYNHSQQTVSALAEAGVIKASPQQTGSA
jgi:hypothetical protein